MNDIKVRECKRCGDCCKTKPGVYHAHQFRNVEKELRHLLEKKHITFDFWEGDFEGIDRPYFPTPMHTKKNPINNEPELSSFPIHRSWGGRCVHLIIKQDRTTGCAIYENRPFECVSLKGCEAGQTMKKRCIRSWAYLQDLIEKLIKEFCK